MMMMMMMMMKKKKKRGAINHLAFNNAGQGKVVEKLCKIHPYCRTGILT